ncbi:mannitol-1-phosphate 5-dehydrogenase [Alkalicoccobacillus porphyridii]|uniref:Mannitol-1-phosphate 5-dehydrogenase n=1 Tax=Alkalicoccobacillus porphyridii TaxID=2597270 RepID=A0A554A3C9_9BACI|nr:mannitol-1-phosphate 5-dehydrogenase [Alkalicoccobacillus porphyridii]TSB48198.1 mannitol-1-phosphate 5-dehydrogenase [Alkalicoccobacillus porphyridii]
MKAVHFGAGNIGRGFIGALLSRAGYEVVFADVNEAVISELNKRGEYTVTIASVEGGQEHVTGVRGLHSSEDEAALIEEIATADLVTTAVGPAILKFIAPTLAKGLQQRAANDKPLDVIACENAIRATSTLKEYTKDLIPDDEWAAIIEATGFADAAVDRIVPNQKNEDILAVSVEPFFEWVVEKPSLKGANTSIEGVTYVDDLIPFIERKLFTVNTGHALAAYFGYAKSLTTIKEAMEDTEVKEKVQAGLNETKQVLVQAYGFDQSEHEAYIQKIIRRFENPYLSDDIVRVGRGPIRKLGFNDRLIKPARMLADQGQTPTVLLEVIEAALHFDVADDTESQELQKLIKEKGKKAALVQVTGLEADHPIIQVLT